MSNKTDKLFSFSIHFSSFLTVQLLFESFCSLSNGISQNICWFCLVLINSVLLNRVFGSSDFSWRKNQASSSMVLHAHKTIRLLKDGRMEVGEDVGGIIYLLLHCHHKKDSCIKVRSDESHFNV